MLGLFSLNLYFHINNNCLRTIFSSPASLVNWSSHHSHSMAIATSWFRGIHRSAFIGDISYVPIERVSCVLGVLDPAIRKSNGVFSLDISSCVLTLSLLEISLRVVISYSILVSIGLGWEGFLHGHRHGVLGEGGGEGEEEGRAQELKYVESLIKM